MATPYEHSLKDFTLGCTPAEPQIKNKNASEYLLEKCRDHAQKGKTTCTVDTISGESFTFAQFCELSKKITSALYKRGMRKGDIVIYMCYDIVKLHIFFTGVWGANGVMRSIYPEELEDSIFQSVIESNSKWILCDATEAPKCLSVAKRINWPVEIIIMGRNVEGCVSIYDLFLGDGKECPPLETKGEDMALILCTSGTTGSSKGAVHTHRNVISIIEKSRICIYFGAARSLFAGRGTHMSGGVVAMATLEQGNTLLSISKFTLEAFVPAFVKYKPVWILSFPALLVAMANDPRGENINTDSLEYIYTGGTYIKPSLEEEMRRKFPNLKIFCSAYGMTESFPLVSGSHKKDSEAHFVPVFEGIYLPKGYMGKVCGGVSAQVRDENGITPLGPNQEGELCVKSTVMFSHYYKQEEETKKAFTKDNWFRTGDIVSYDENGFFAFHGRQKEMFKSSGNNHEFVYFTQLDFINPAEIDEVISKHPSVADVCAVGVDDPNGEKMPRAFITLKPGTNTTAEEIKAFADKNLPVYKQLRGGLYIVPELPKGSTGKVSRILVAKLPVPG